MPQLLEENALAQVLIKAQTAEVAMVVVNQYQEQSLQ